MTISKFIELLEEIKRENGDVEVLGYIKKGWYISAMGAGKLTREKESRFHRFVVALFTHSSFERD